MKTASLPALAAAIALAGLAPPVAGAAPVADVGEAGAPPSCALQCITAATVVPRTGAAVLHVRTTVRSRLVVTVRTPGDGSGLASHAVVERRSGPVRRKRFRLLLPGLRPGTRYTIQVRATDADGARSTRAGSFSTREVETVGWGASSALSGQTGCQTQCITGATAVREHDGIRFRIRTSRQAHVTVEADRVAPQVSVTGVPSFANGAAHTFSGWTQDRALSFRMGDLESGALYHVIVRAQDENGYVAWRSGTVTTRRRHVEVRFTHVEVIADGDGGIKGRGELLFEGLADGEHAFGNGCARRSGGDWFAVSHPPIVRTNARRELALTAIGQESDGFPDNCRHAVYEAVEAVGPSGWISGDSPSGWATTTLDLDRLLRDLGPDGATSLVTGFEVGLTDGAAPLRFRMVGELRLAIEG